MAEMSIGLRPRPRMQPTEDFPDVPDPPPAPDPPAFDATPAPISENLIDEMRLLAPAVNMQQEFQEQMLNDDQRRPVLASPPLPPLAPPSLPPSSHPDSFPDTTKTPIPDVLTLSAKSATNTKSAGTVKNVFPSASGIEGYIKPQDQKNVPVSSSHSMLATQLPVADASASTSVQPSITLKDLPPIPQFPSVTDVSSDWPEATAGPSTATANGTIYSTDDKVETKTNDEVAWNRPAAAERSTKEATEPAPTATPDKPPLLQRVKLIVCQLPDPTLFFLAEATVMLALHTVRPDLLRTWTARIVVPLLLLPTVAMSALWRPTHIVALPGRAVLNPIKPIPDAAGVVEKGAALRGREAAVGVAEEALQEGQLKLETLRQEVQRKLPPAASISNMLASEAHTGDMPATAPPLTE